MDGFKCDSSLKQDNFTSFALSIVLFSLASSIFFTPFPIFLNQGLGLHESWVYVAYMLNSTGAIVGYFFIRTRARNMNTRKQMPRFILMRGLLIFGLIAVMQFTFFPNMMTGTLLLLLGFVYAIYYILMLSLSMEVIPEGKSGLFDGLVGLGAAVGSFLGPFLADTYNYLPTFLVAAILLMAAYISLKIIK
jgi:predicted MFS family arabinose efflux permease